MGPGHELLLAAISKLYGIDMGAAGDDDLCWTRS